MVVGGYGLFAALVLQVPDDWWAGPSRFLSAHWSTALLVVASLAVLVTGLVVHRRTDERPVASAAATPPDRPLRPLPSWTIIAGAALVVVVTSIAVGWLQSGVPDGGDPIERARLRVEAIRTGLSVGAGLGAALALLLALRRQQLAERTQQATEYDAGEKRVTELYLKAADQLGSDRAPVRLAGLYALERLAQDNPVHRQSIVEVICAYLRMPYPVDPAPASVPSQPVDLPDENSPTTGADVGGGDREERQVRITAQRVLARHLRPTNSNGRPNPVFWGPVDLDLTEATLIDLDFNACRLRRARFDGATFTGLTRFNQALFVGDAGFEKVTFLGDVWFDDASFTGDAWFQRASFAGVARFEGASFSSFALFVRASFGGLGRFGGVKFDSFVLFGGASFATGADFHLAFATDQPVNDLPKGWQIEPTSGRVVRVPASGETEVQDETETVDQAKASEGTEADGDAEKAEDGGAGNEDAGP